MGSGGFWSDHTWGRQVRPLIRLCGEAVGSVVGL